MAGPPKGHWPSNWEIVSALILAFYFIFLYFFIFLWAHRWFRLSIVWEESLTQIEQMIQYYDKSEPINTSHRDFRRATLGIMTRAGFSKVMRWIPLTDEKDGEGNYQKCLNVLFENLVWAIIAPSWLLG